MKKIVCLALTAVMLLSALACFTSCGEALKYELSADGTYYIVAESLNAKGDFVIPDTYKDLPVKEVANSAFANNTYITSVVFPDSIEVIGSSVFNNCHSLTGITIGKNVREIKDYAFSGASALSEVNFCGTEEEWVTLCRYTTYTYKDETRKSSKVADDLKNAVVRFDYVRP